MSAQNNDTTARNCDNEVQKRTDTKPACELPLLPSILTAVSSIMKEMAEIPFKNKFIYDTSDSERTDFLLLVSNSLDISKWLPLYNRSLVYILLQVGSHTTWVQAV